ncbi:MAG: alkylphosphonate uptake protein [Bacteroidota bacterium]
MHSFGKTNPMSLPPCPHCKSVYAYESGALLMCPECGHEWSPESATVAVESDPDQLIVKDSNGIILQNGDSVIIIKNLPVAGAPKPIKSGTKVKSIRLVEGDHNIDCRIEGYGAMALKSEFVRKA